MKKIFVYSIAVVITFFTDIVLGGLIVLLRRIKQLMEQLVVSKHGVFVRRFAKIVEDQADILGWSVICAEVNHSETKFEFVFKTKNNDDFDGIKEMIEYQEALKILPRVDAIKKIDSGFVIIFKEH